MSEENKLPPVDNATPEKVTMTTIALTDMITLEVSGLFLQRVHNLLLTMCDEVGQKETIAIIERLRKDEAPQTTHEESIRVLIALVDGIETAAKEQGKTKDKELTPEEVLQVLEFFSLKDEPTPPPSGS